jgi:hypothetical protein
LDWQPDHQELMVNCNIEQLLTPSEYQSFLRDVDADIHMKPSQAPKWKEGDNIRYRYVGKELGNRQYWDKIFKELATRLKFSQPGKTKIILML